MAPLYFSCSYSSRVWQRKKARTLAVSSMGGIEDHNASRWESRSKDCYSQQTCLFSLCTSSELTTQTNLCMVQDFHQRPTFVTEFMLIQETLRNMLSPSLPIVLEKEACFLSQNISAIQYHANKKPKPARQAASICQRSVACLCPITRPDTEAKVWHPSSQTNLEVSKAHLRLPPQEKTSANFRSFFQKSNRSRPWTTSATYKAVSNSLEFVHSWLL